MAKKRVDNLEIMWTYIYFLVYFNNNNNNNCINFVVKNYGILLFQKKNYEILYCISPLDP